MLGAKTCNQLHILMTQPRKQNTLEIVRILRCKPFKLLMPAELSLFMYSMEKNEAITL